MELAASSLLFQIGHIGSGHMLSEELHSTERSDFSSVVVIDKESNALDALIFDVWQDQIVSVFFVVIVGMVQLVALITMAFIQNPET